MLAFEILCTCTRAPAWSYRRVTGVSLERAKWKHEWDLRSNEYPTDSHGENWSKKAERTSNSEIPSSPSSFGTSIPCSALSFFITSPSFASPSSDIDAVSFFMMTCTSVLRTQDSANVLTAKHHRNLEKVSHLDCRHCGYTAICRKSWLLCIVGSVHVCRHGACVVTDEADQSESLHDVSAKIGYHFMCVIYLLSQKPNRQSQNILYITCLYISQPISLLIFKKCWRAINDVSCAANGADRCPASWNAASRMDSRGNEL